MPNISQQDYIIIDWEGKSQNDAAKKAEVNAILKNLYLSNPLTLLSVVFKDFDLGNSKSSFTEVVAVGELSDSPAVYIIDYEDGATFPYPFSID